MRQLNAKQKDEMLEIFLTPRNQNYKGDRDDYIYSLWWSSIDGGYNIKAYVLEHNKTDRVVEPTDMIGRGKTIKEATYDLAVQILEHQNGEKDV